MLPMALRAPFLRWREYGDTLEAALSGRRHDGAQAWQPVCSRQACTIAWLHSKRCQRTARLRAFIFLFNLYNNL